jgi:outer membrane protein
MRKYSLLLALAGSVVAVSGVAGQAAQPAANPPGNGAKIPIAYVRSQLLFQEAPGAADARTTIQREMDKYQAELALAEDSIKNLLTDYQQRQVMMSPDAKKRQEDLINAKKKSLDTRAEQYDAVVRKRQQELVQPIMEKINKILEDVRKEKGISMIVDGSQQGVIIAADTTLDLTREILSRLKAQGPAAPPKKN